MGLSRHQWALMTPAPLVSAAAAAASWQLASGHYIAAKMAANIIHPRTDAEMNAWARAARCPSAIAWEIPIVVQGGSWPFRYVLTTGPSGMTITETLDHAQWNGATPLGGANATYGVLSWSNPVVGSHTVTVTVTGQDGTSATRTWTLEVIDRENTTYFCFVNSVSGNNTTGTGAFSSPKLDFAGWYGASKGDTSCQTKQIHYRGGTYNISGVISTAILEGEDLGPGRNSLDSKFPQTSGKPHVHVAYPGEAVVFDNNNQAFWDYQTGQDDSYFGGMTWQGCTVIENSANRKTHIRLGTNSNARACFYDVRFIGDDQTSGTGSNPACLMFSGNPDPGSYFVVSRCHFQNCDNMDLGLFYDTSDVVCEYNETSGGYTATTPGAGGFFFKANTIARVTVRANVQLANDGGTYDAAPMLYFSQFVTNSVDARDDIEFCWNRVRNNANDTGSEGSGAVGIGQALGTNGNHYGSFWSYRNTMHNPHIMMKGIGLDDRDSSVPGPFTFENDVIHHSGTYPNGIYELDCHASVDAVVTNCATDTALLTSDLLLAAGSPRDTYYGTHGSEVA